MSALLGLLLNPKTLGWLGVGFLVLAIGVQTLRLNHAKADQIDPATHSPWRTEELRDGPALAVSTRNLTTCQDNFATEDAALQKEVGAVNALTAQGASDTAKANAAAQKANAATQSSAKLIASILAPHADHSCAAAQALIKGSIQ